MRIVSLVPSATELCGALGLEPELVAVTHECDHPESVRELPRLTRSVIEAGLSPAEIDRAVLERTGRGEALYRLDEETLRSLEPELVLAQRVCAVCAVSYEDVVSVAARMPRAPEVVSLDPSSLDDVLDDAVRVAEAADRRERGLELRRRLRERIERVAEATARCERPRVVALEWLDPPYIAGHWVPEMIEAAGGEDVLGSPGAPSLCVGWERIREAEPEIVVVMPCGLDQPSALRDASAHWLELEALAADACWAVDAAASFSRPGPRLADGVELLGHLLHPEVVPDPGDLGFSRVAPG